MLKCCGVPRTINGFCVRNSDRMRVYVDGANKGCRAFDIDVEDASAITLSQLLSLSHLGISSTDVCRFKVTFGIISCSELTKR